MTSLAILVSAALQLPVPAAPVTESEAPVTESEAPVTEPVAPATAPAASTPVGKVTKVTSVIQLQPRAETNSITIPETEKSPQIKLKLINLNPNIGAWFVLAVESGKEKETLHLELQTADTDQLFLTESGLQISRELAGKSETINCEPFDSAFFSRIKNERKENYSYTEFCSDLLVIRHPISGRQTAKEFVTGFLRDKIWGGEKITTIVKETFFQDKYLLSGKPEANTNLPSPAPLTNILDQNQPRSAMVDQKYSEQTLTVNDLGIRIENNPDKLTVGQWYPVEGQPDMHISVFEPGMADKSVLSSHKKIVGNLDKVESEAITLLIAFKLDKFDASFMMGTDHPRVDWSERALASSVDKSIAGPDGIATIDPLVGTGKVPPYKVGTTAATFVGGFKRSHGAFKWGELAKINHGSHYGFVEQGVILSKLNPGLATVIINKKNEMSVKTWTVEDDTTLLPQVKHARQNGVAIVDGIDASSGQLLPIPGALVNQWGPGNWSGSIESKLRALRAGLCRQKNGDAEYMIYGYFSTATPNAMARVFQAYGCDYGIHLDMNALEHTYFAVYERDGMDLKTQHLIKGMHVLDSTFQGKSLPRFLGSADNRDFFYLKRKP